MLIYYLVLAMMKFVFLWTMRGSCLCAKVTTPMQPFLLAGQQEII